MFKKFIYLCFIITSFASYSFAQDTSAYQLQRAKINALLAERSAKFGQYDQSLNTRTGIFGFQTKNDIKNSNEILRQIAITDNEIFTELKVLMDYKDLQVEQVKSTYTMSSERIQNYRRTIKTLQEQNQDFNDRLDKIEKSRDIAYLLAAIALISCAVFVYLFIGQRKNLKRNEKTVL